MPRCRPSGVTVRLLQTLTPSRTCRALRAPAIGTRLRRREGAFCTELPRSSPGCPLHRRLPARLGRPSLPGGCIQLLLSAPSDRAGLLQSLRSDASHPPRLGSSRRVKARARVGPAGPAGRQRRRRRVLQDEGRREPRLHKSSCWALRTLETHDAHPRGSQPGSLASLYFLRHIGGPTTSLAGRQFRSARAIRLGQSIPNGLNTEVRCDKADIGTNP